MEKTKNTDIIAGIPSFNNQKTISYVTEQIGKTFDGYCKGKKCLVVDCDGGSTDDTIKNFFDSKTKAEKRVFVSLPGTTGKGNVFKTLFKYAKISKAKTVLVNDSDLRSINPRWIKLQLDSIQKKGYDYATPLYSRYKYDGTITKHICYPLIYGLFCRDIRQPIGGDFAFSSRLSNHWLKCKWPVNAKLFGIDIFMTTNAILGDFKICQVNLKAKIHDVKDPAKTLSPMFRQVISTLFKIIIDNPEKLKNMKQVKSIPVLGDKKLGKPQEFKINNQATKDRFVRGFIRRREVIKKFVSKEDYTSLRTMVHYSNVHIPSTMWARIVYDYILAFKKYEKQSSTLLKSFIPLWFGRIYTFVNETTKMDTKQAEVLIRKQAQEFFKQRNYLLDKL